MSNEAQTAVETKATNGKAEKKEAKEVEKPKAKETKEAHASTVPAAEAAWEWEFTKDVGTEHRFMTAPPKEFIITPFDSRDSEGVLADDFLASIKEEGVQTPIVVAPVRRKDNHKMTGFAVLAGRRRLKAATAAHNERNKEVPAHIVPVASWEEAMKVAINENMQRQPMTPWDIVMKCRWYKDRGHPQSEIKKWIGPGVSDAYVSQHLQVLDMPAVVQKYVRAGKLDISKTRVLARFKDEEQLVAYANKTVENGWRAEDIQEMVERVKARTEQAEKDARKKARTAKKAEGGEAAEAAGGDEEEEEESPYAKAELAVLVKKPFRAALEWAANAYNKARMKEVEEPKINEATKKYLLHEKKVAYNKGRIEGLEYAAGLRELPKALLEDE